MKRNVFALFGVLFCFSVFAQNKSLLELKYEENYTPTYDEVIEMYQLPDKVYPNATLLEKGKTDIGKPLHLFVINNEPVFNPAEIRKQGKSVLLINNGIHPGEPAGIDARLQFADDILCNNTEWAEKTYKRYPATKIFKKLSETELKSFRKEKGSWEGPFL
jgi:hypothetical protein